MSDTPQIVGRYALHGALAAGGMATVHLGRLRGAAGFARTVAIKRLHSQFARDPEFIAMFLDEARLAARIRHPNVVPTLDVVAEADELFLVMEYVHGESLARAWRTLTTAGQRMPQPIASAVVVGALHGLHAAHEARDERGRPLEVVHRDVSPQNVMIGADGVARVLDFGVAKALGRSHQTREGQIKGKLAYMAPEQYRREPVSRLVDVYAASVVLWEALTGQRLHAGDSEASVVESVLFGEYRGPSTIAPGLPSSIDDVLAKGLARKAADRFATAQDLAIAVEGCLGAASALEVAAWIGEVAGPALAKRAKLLEIVEREASLEASRPSLPNAAAQTVPERPAPAALTLTPTKTAHADGPAWQKDGATGATAATGTRSRALGWTLGALGAATFTAGVTVFELGSRQSAPHGGPPSPLVASAPSSASSPASPPASSPLVASAEWPAPSSVPLPAPSSSVDPVAAAVVSTGPDTPDGAAPPRRRSRPAGPSPRSDPALPRGLPATRD
jgi:serine/threonine-protein kinase